LRTFLGLSALFTLSAAVSRSNEGGLLRREHAGEASSVELHSSGSMKVDESHAAVLDAEASFDGNWVPACHVFCRRRRRAIDCAWSDWKGWTPCTKNCGAGMKQRDRTTDGPHHKGKRCEGAKAEYLTCNTHNCAVDCQWNTWGAWGPCSTTCGGGKRIRERGALPFTDRDGGAHCPDSLKKMNGDCNGFACPVNCKWSEWSLWKGCTKTCGTGVRHQDRTQLIAASNGGAVCTGTTDNSEPCNPHYCPVSCVYQPWTAWGVCSMTCGGGIKLRERAYQLQSSNGGASCQGAPAEVLACNIEDCPIDCAWGDWHHAATCSKTCGGGVMNRHRVRKTEMMFAGQACTGPSTEIGPCNVEPCAVECQYEEWQPYSECTQSCGGGLHRRFRNATAPLHNGAPCDEALKEAEEECNIDECEAEIENGGRPTTVLLPMLTASLLWIQIWV